MTQNIREQILELFCGFPIDCTTETEIKLDEILKAHLNTTLYEKGMEDEAIHCEGNCKVAYEKGVKDAMELVDKHDPSINRETSPAYWGKTLRLALLELLEK